MVEPILTVTDSIVPEALAVIDNGLHQFNIAASGIDDWQALGVFAVDPQTQRVLGGLTGRTSLGLLFIDVFFLPEELRGGGLGSRILRMAEDEAARQPCWLRSASRRPGSTNATAGLYSARSTASPVSRAYF